MDWGPGTGDWGPRTKGLRTAQGQRTKNQGLEMPEGDTIHRAARSLQRALAGHPVTRFRSVYPALTRVELMGQTIETVNARGKHLLMTFSGGLTLHTHMRMHGSWHIYRPGERWRLPSREMRIAIETPRAVAVAFNVPVAAAAHRARDGHPPGPRSSRARPARSGVRFPGGRGSGSAQAPGRSRRRSSTSASLPVSATCSSRRSCLPPASTPFVLTDWQEFSEIPMGRVAEAMRGRLVIDGRKHPQPRSRRSPPAFCTWASDARRESHHGVGRMKALVAGGAGSVGN